MENTSIINKYYQISVVGINEIMLLDKNEWLKYISALSEHLQVTYLVVLFHNQVFNGGFHQYFFNAYGQFAYELLDSLTTIGAKSTVELLKKVLSKVNSEGIIREEFRSKVHNRELVKITEFDTKLGDFLDKCDQEYYDQEEDIVKLLAKYLERYEKTIMFK